MDLDQVKAALQLTFPELSRMLHHADLAAFVAGVEKTIDEYTATGRYSEALALGGIVDQFAECVGECRCAPRRWQDFLDLIQDALRPIAAYSWAADAGPEQSGVLSLRKLRSGRHPQGRDECTRIEVIWDGVNQLRVAFRPAGSDDCITVTLTALLGPYEEAHSYCIYDAANNDALGRELLRYRAPIIRAANRWYKTRYDDGTYQEVLNFLSEHDFETLLPAAQEVVEELAGEWKQSLGELLTAARNLVT